MVDTNASKTTRTMAYLLLALFGLCLVVTLFTAIFLRDDKWLTSFKDGFAFLAGALATIIGYYFGNRNTDVAFEKAREATDKAIEAKAKVNTSEAKNAELLKQILEVTKADDPANTTSSPITDEDALDRPQA